MQFTELDSPSLIVDASIVRKNIHEMIRMVGDANRLRPHIKTHKTAEGIQLMIAAGIHKFKCATIAEAELLANNGADRKSTRLNSSHEWISRMPSSA